MPGTAPLILWSYALAALLFAGLALSRLRDAATGLPRLTFIIALGVTALWALAVAGIETRDMAVRVMGSVRDLGWLGFMYALVRRRPDAPGRREVAVIYGVVALVIVAVMGLTIVEPAFDATAMHDLAAVRVLLRMMIAISALVLVHHLHSAIAPQSRGGIRLVALALAAMWGADLLLFATAYATGRWSPEIIAARGLVMALSAPLFAVALQRGGDWTLQLSRTVAWQTLSLAATLFYAAVMLIATSVIARVSGEHARLWQSAFVFGSTAAALAILSSPWVRAWAKVKVAKHFFRHRYDYRAEWTRFTETLGKPDGAAPLAERIVKAVADLTDSPGGLLLVPDGAGLGVGAGWHWDGPGLGTGARAEPALVAYLTASGRIVELDTVRAGVAGAAEAACVPGWMLDTGAWALVPLAHLDRLQGAILLARPPVDRALDWEDFDLLRMAGRQVASYLAEARAQEALAEAERFDEFNRRFAFILHDIKNLVSQLTLVARNAERHADNPAFRADMIATLQDSAGRMNDLLARLSQHHRVRAEELRAVDLRAIADRVAGSRRTQHSVMVMGPPVLFALADPVRLEQVLGHLVQNAIEASAPTEPVLVVLAEADGAGEGARGTIEVIDRGCGMTPAFVRDQLFKPFVSSKPGGFGIGAFEARQLAEAMGATIAVTSRAGEGTRFRLALPLATAPTQAMERAA